MQSAHAGDVHLRRRHVRALGVLVVLSGLAAACGTSTAGTASFVHLPAATVLHEALAAAGHQHSVHAHATVQAGPTSGTVDADVATDQATAVVTLGPARLSAVLVGPTLFVRANQAALVQLLDLPADVAATNAGRWLRLVPDDRPYAALTADLTLRGLVAQLAVAPPLSSTTSTAGGTPVVQVAGGAPAGVKPPGGTAVLSVSARPPHLPVSLTVHTAPQPVPGALGAGPVPVPGTATLKLSRWGEPVTATAPAGAIPFVGLSA